MIKLQRTLVRELPLSMIDAYLKGYEGTEKLFGSSLPKNYVLFIQGAAAFYRDEQEHNIVTPKKLAAWIKDKDNQKKLNIACRKTTESLKAYQKIGKELQHKKKLDIDALLSRLTRVCELFIQGFPGFYALFWFPIWQEKFKKELFPPALIRELKRAREKTEPYFDDAMKVAFSLLHKIAENKKWPKETMKFITYPELCRAISSDKLPLELLEERKRAKLSYYQGKIVAGAVLENKLKKEGIILEERVDRAKIKEIKGTIANRGRTEGKIKIVFSREQLDKVQKGDILVAPMTTPWYLPAIKKASAIVTEEGGITCHAAIVSRELNKPCIIGTKIATKVLKDGDLVDVDATHGKVNIIKKAKK